MGLEFYIYNDELWYITDDGDNRKLAENDPYVSEFFAIIQEQYPDAFDALSAIYSKSRLNLPYYQYLVVRRFCKCNFGTLDNSSIDIANDKHNFEKVVCPLRGECQHEGIICMPRFNSQLSPAEHRVMELLYKGCDVSEIGSQLYISPNTVRNHIKSSYAKLGIHEKSEFIKYADKNNLFTFKN